jgi:hypothetical protein
MIQETALASAASGLTLLVHLHESPIGRAGGEDGAFEGKTGQVRDAAGGGGNCVQMPAKMGRSGLLLSTTPRFITTDTNRSLLRPLTFTCV